MITTNKSKWIQLFWPPIVADYHALVHVQNLGTSTSLLSTVQFKVPYSLLNMNTWCHTYRTIQYWHACSYLGHTQKNTLKRNTSDYTHPSFILSIHEYNQEGQGWGLGVWDTYPYIPLLVVSFTIHYNKLIILLQVFCHTTSRRQRITFNPPLPNIKPRYLPWDLHSLRERWLLPFNCLYKPSNTPNSNP